MLASCLTRIGRTPIRGVQTQQLAKHVGVCGTLRLNSAPAIWATQIKSLSLSQICKTKEDDGQKLPPPFGKPIAILAKCIWFISGISLGVVYVSKEVEEVEAKLPRFCTEHRNWAIALVLAPVLISPFLISTYPFVQSMMRFSGVSLAIWTNLCMCYKYGKPVTN